MLVTLIAFTLATGIGLVIALLGLSDSKALRQVSRFYIELIRGIPVLVLLFYVAFVGAPGFVAGMEFRDLAAGRAGLVDRCWCGTCR